MNSVIRPSTPADLPQLQLLARVAFSEQLNPRFADTSLFHWKYWSRRGDFSRPRSYVTETDGRISAHVGIWPLQAPGINGAHAIDWMATPDVPGAGSLIYSTMASHFDFLFGIGGTQASLRIMPALGYQQIGETRTWGRPLRPLRQAMLSRHCAPRLLSRLRWAREPGWPDPGPWSLTEPEPGGTAERPGEFFEHLRQCPHARMTIHGLTCGGRPEGTLAMACIARQARVAGLWLRQDTEENWVAALSLAARRALEDPYCCELVFKCASETSARAAARLGMRLLYSEKVFSLTPDGRRYVPPIQFQFVDDDASFRSLGTGPEFMT